MMWVYNHHKHFYSFSAGIDQNTTSVDVIFWSRKSISVLKGLKVQPFKSLKHFDPFKPEFTIVIFIHYKPRIAVAILDL